ncbi:unnamed protein product, partial [Mesorhabditis spiculigera]
MRLLLVTLTILLATVCNAYRVPYAQQAALCIQCKAVVYTLTLPEIEHHQVPTVLEGVCSFTEIEKQPCIKTLGGILHDLGTWKAEKTSPVNACRSAKLCL